MAREGAKRLRELIATGEEIPYEVREPGNGSPLAEYEPLTARFVRDHAGALRELDSFGAACAALEAADLAGPYLERMGIAVPAEPRRRAELAGVVFLCRLWMDSSDFSLDQERLEAAIAELECEAEVDEGEIEVAVPVRGLQLPITRLALATATLVRSDTVDVPPEARTSEGLGASPWEPTYLAVARIPEPEPGVDEAGAGTRAVEVFRRLITTLRLYKGGGVALGPHAWTKAPGDRWRRISTGAGRPRPGGYRLSESEPADLAAFSHILADPATPFGRLQSGSGLSPALERALVRFEAGLERQVGLDAVCDHLLALRFVLEGGGPADLGLSMRVAALCAEPERRAEVKAVVDRAVALERELWSGEPAAASDASTPADVAAELEELTRAILKDAACGHLGSDLRAAADEILLADGLAAGEGAAEQRGATAEWDLDEGAVEAPDEHEDEIAEVAEADEEPYVEAQEPGQAELWLDVDPELEVFAGVGRTVEQGESEPQEDEIVIGRRRRAELSRDEGEAKPRTAVLEALPTPPGGPEPMPDDQPRQSPVLRLIDQTHAERKARQERMANLFPEPEPCEWDVRELGYDRRAR